MAFGYNNCYRFDAAISNIGFFANSASNYACKSILVFES